MNMNHIYKKILTKTFINIIYPCKYIVTIVEIDKVLIINNLVISQIFIIILQKCKDLYLIIL